MMCVEETVVTKITPPQPPTFGKMYLASFLRVTYVILLLLEKATGLKQNSFKAIFWEHYQSNAGGCLCPLALMSFLPT